MKMEIQTVLFRRLLGLVACACVVGMATNVKAINYDLHSSEASIISGNLVSTFIAVDGSGGVSGTGSSLVSSVTLGGTASTGFFVEIDFSGLQPVLSDALLKAGDQYLYWDSTDLVGFNAGTYTSITLWNSNPGGIMNNPGNAFLGTSHSGLDGSPGTGRVPDGGATALLLGAALSGLALIRRKLS